MQKETQKRSLRQQSIYLLPNLFTLSALFAGFYGVVQAMNGHFKIAAVAVFIAMILDGLDGRVARLTHSQSEFGAQLDSLSDMVSFGVAPALISYTWMLHDFGKLGWSVAFIYCACAALRLALFNTMIGTADKRWFIGIPSPTAAALVTGLVWISYDNKLVNFTYMPYVCLFITAFAGISMVVQIKFWSFKEINIRRKVPFFGMLIVLAALIALMWSPSFMLFGFFVLYSLSGYVLAAMHYLKKSPTPPSQDTDAAQ
ncbi:CDP-diacylglycerol--serine O-phosphatidyltransferase [Neisseria sp. Ec49-e6-T10]